MVQIMTNNSLTSSLKTLEVDSTIIQKLNQNNITEVKELWKMKKI